MKQKKGTKSLRARYQKHLTDKNDIITEDDLKNIKVGDDVPEEDHKSAEELAEAVKSRKTTSPWAILSEEDK